MDMSLTEALNAVQDLSNVLNGLTDVALSGTPRICNSRTYFFKVFPTYAGSATAPFDPSAWKTYDNTDLSGSPKLLAFAHNGNVFFVKGYPTAAETSNPTTDFIQNLMTNFRDDIAAGEPTIFRILSGANYYYFKAYREADFIEPAAPITPATPTVISTPLSEARTAVRDMLQDPAAKLYSDTEIDSWLDMAAIDVSGKTLCCRENKTFYVPVNDLSGSLNRIIDSVLSGTPRVCETQNHYFKVFPTREDATPPPLDPAAWKTSDDTALSGTPKRLGFAYESDLYWVKGYPTAAAISNPTADSIQNLAFSVPDDAVSGAPNVFEILSGGNYYYFKAYKLYGYSAGDALTTLPLPTGTLKLLFVQRTTDGGYPQGMMRIHPRMTGRQDIPASGDPRFFFDFAQELGLAPGRGSSGFALNLHRAFLVDTFVDLPIELQPSAIIYAYVLALYKALKFETAAMSYRTYLINLFQIRNEIYEMTADNKADFILADRKELVK